MPFDTATPALTADYSAMTLADARMIIGALIGAARAGCRAIRQEDGTIRWHAGPWKPGQPLFADPSTPTEQYACSLIHRDWMRRDTLRIVARRDMTAEERQAHLDRLRAQADAALRGSR